jgi:very-short-patch-repair endonuclease
MNSNSLLDGFQLDIDFPEIKLNIELDSAKNKYPSKVRSDRYRDEYLKIKQQYNVIRLEISGKNVDDVVKEIYEIYTINNKKWATLQ